MAIALVPPLAVVGMCIGLANPYQALGALILFLSSVAAMIAACPKASRCRSSTTWAPGSADGVHPAGGEGRLPWIDIQYCGL